MELQNIVGICKKCGIIEKTDFDRIGGKRSIHLQPDYTHTCPLCERKLRTGVSCPNCGFPIYNPKEKLQKIKKVYCGNCNSEIFSYRLYSRDLTLEKRRNLQYKDLKNLITPILKKGKSIEITESSSFDMKLLIDMESNIPEFNIKHDLDKEKLILRWKNG